MTASPESLVNVKSGAGSPSLTIVPSSRRAIGVVRVSRVGEREGDSFVSPSEQRERIGAACARDGLNLLDVMEEPNVSGGAPLERRHGLREAVERVERGEADVIVVAYFDRLVRSLPVQAEVVGRVEQAGGAILAVDVGEVRADTASRWLSSTMLGMVAEYHRRVTAERTQDAKRRAVARGVAPFPKIPPGYRRGRGGAIEVDKSEASAVREAFELRADGATIMDVREHLRRHGVERSFHGVQGMLSSRLYVGELRFGEYVKDDPALALVDAETFRKVQRIRVPRGRRPKSDRLLSRLGVLRCASCGARMVVGTTRQQGKRYTFYRCPPVGDCSERVTVSADLAERVVIDAVKAYLHDVEGSANLDVELTAARAEAKRIDAELTKAVEAFSGLDDVEAVRDRLTALRDERERARDRVEEVAAAVGPALTITAGDWDDLSSAEQRDLIRVVCTSATVAPGRGPDRIAVELRKPRA